MTALAENFMKHEYGKIGLVGLIRALLVIAKRLTITGINCISQIYETSVFRLTQLGVCFIKQGRNDCFVIIFSK